jgi:hypothetical protein
MFRCMGDDHKDCWACSIPDLIWAKLALYECAIAFTIHDGVLTILVPALLHADENLQKLALRPVWGVAGKPRTIQHIWKVHARSMTPEKWDELLTEIAERVRENNWLLVP